jgi:antitoxin component YwqK of YwqJK toxin-antitoxin module
MKQGKRIAATMVISSVLIFGGCNAAPTDKAEKEKPYSDTAEIIQEAVLTNESQKTAQLQTKDTTINQTDRQGRKQGLWIEDNGLKEVYYLNGKKNGVHKSYFKKTGKLEALGWYEQDKPTGNWYYFDETSRLFLSEQILSENKKLKVKNDEGNFILMPFQSYVKLYHKNGLVAKEGTALYDEDVLIDFYMHGNWKYYDEAGKLIKEENYPEGKAAN